MFFLPRDMKSANVLIGENNLLVLVDFGISTEIPKGRSFTFAKFQVGTYSHMSPEEITSDIISPAKDIWSVW